MLPRLLSFFPILITDILLANQKLSSSNRQQTYRLLLLQHGGEHVEAATVGHAQHNVLHTEVARIVDDPLQSRDGGCAKNMCVSERGSVWCVCVRVHECECRSSEKLRHSQQYGKDGGGGGAKKGPP